jgi:iron-sulfur cluster assembly protein
MKDIISISDEAATQIKKILSASKQDVNGIVVGVDKTGCSGYAYKIEYANKDKTNNYELVESKGVKVFIEPTATMFLIGSEMDYTKDKLSSRFVFNNPNEKSSCGCGESFSI